ncbi:MAG: hypothetical protein ACXVW3_16490 [Nocardioidaceae bacterium]
MTKYILIYRGPATPMEEMSEEQGKEQMALWTVWMDKVGQSIVDLGMPFGARSGVAGDGTDTSPPDLQGYTVVEADSLVAAKAMCDGHPFLSTGEANFVIDVFELVPIEM